MAGISDRLELVHLAKAVYASLPTEEDEEEYVPVGTGWAWDNVAVGASCDLDTRAPSKNVKTHAAFATISKLGTPCSTLLSRRRLMVNEMLYAI